MTGHATEDQFAGCLLGLALGDALGAPHEGGPLERFAWRLIGRTRQNKSRWTDDTQMSLDLAESLIANGHIDPDDLARRFSRSYQWSRGYGPGAAKVLKKIARGTDWRVANTSIHKTGSFGNGAAMRAPMVGLFFGSVPQTLPDVARQSAIITHAHPLGIEGAILIAKGTATALETRAPRRILAQCSEHASEPYREKLELADRMLGSRPSATEVRDNLGNGIAATDSCVSALLIAALHLDRPFLEMLTFTADCGGDVDTIGAMAGAIWGAAHGAAALPVEKIVQIEQADRLQRVARELHAATQHASRNPD